jgi:ribonuclease P protein component
VRQTGASYAQPFFILCLLSNGLCLSRCGFTASRRVGNAVARNRARRRMREVVRLLWDLIEPGWDLVWVARPGINGADFADLQEAGARLVLRAGVLKASTDANQSVQEV